MKAPPRFLSALVPVAVAALVLVATPAPAQATTTSIEGWVYTSTWTHYSTTRSTTGTVKFTPSNLLYQAGPVSVLNLRLRRTNGTWLSNSVQWQNYSQKTIISGVSSGTQFRISACCYSSTGGDPYWAGSLVH